MEEAKKGEAEDVLKKLLALSLIHISPDKSQAEFLTDSYGVVHNQPVLVSLNTKYSPILISRYLLCRIGSGDPHDSQEGYQARQALL